MLHTGAEVPARRRDWRSGGETSAPHHAAPPTAAPPGSAEGRRGNPHMIAVICLLPRDLPASFTGVAGVIQPLDVGLRAPDVEGVEIPTSGVKCHADPYPFFTG